MVEFRKLISFGKTSYVMSLPKSWVIKNNLKKGDLIGLEEKEGNLMLNPKINDSEDKPQEIEICLDGLDRTSIMYLIRSVYRKGYDIIKIRFNDQICTHYRTGEKKKIISVIHEEVNRLVGVEIVEQKEKLSIVRSISEPSAKEFETVLRRLFLLLMDASQDLLTGVKSNDKALIGTIDEKHNTISKFSSYCLRIINKGKLSNNQKNTYFLYHIIASLDKITDILKYSARKILDYKKPLKKETINVLEQIIESWRNYYDIFYKFDINKVDILSRNRDDVKIKIKKLSKNIIPNEESLILGDMKNSLEILLDLTEAKMSLAY